MKYCHLMIQDYVNLNGIILHYICRYEFDFSKLEILLMTLIIHLFIGFVIFDWLLNDKILKSPFYMCTFGMTN